MTGELLIDLDEAARRLSMCRRSVQQLIHEGELLSVKVGRSRRVAVADLETFVRGLREEPADDVLQTQLSSRVTMRACTAGKRGSSGGTG